MRLKSFVDCSHKQQVERWENVVRVLRALTPHQRRKHWNMGEWTQATECGTVACAAGHCGMDPWFRRRGFKMGPKNLRDPWSLELFSYPEDFFGEVGSQSIFYGNGKGTVSQIIKKVDAHIKRLKAGPEKGGYED